MPLGWIAAAIVVIVAAVLGGTALWLRRPPRLAGSGARSRAWG
ncbi:MAG TPA: hypothetical protein VE343_08025 [Streptosporangiaceae bacterium]|nr:hypothetical protein [Streptosporangiaceae bacterium]